MARGHPPRARRGPDETPQGDRHHTVFINCPFDAAYEPLLDALVFTTVCTGFYPVTALESDHRPATRIERIVEAIFTARYSIHDLSRLRGEGTDLLARFNMPLELGIALGRQRAAKQLGDEHFWLVLVPEGYDYIKVVSDLAGFDPVKHGSTVESLIPGVLKWLFTHQDALDVVTPAKVLEALPGFQARKAMLKSGWAGGIPWNLLVREALAAIPRV